jgi:argininosuccinate lyase
MNEKDKKSWSGRFSGQTDKGAEAFNASVAFDSRLFRQDIMGSIAHAKMLGAQGIIPVQESQAIIEALSGIVEDIEAGKVAFSSASEDIHMSIEALLTQRIGEPGKKLHTARSRNDQVALDVRLWVRDAVKSLSAQLVLLEKALLDTASQHTESVLPGYTHLQVAQPVTLGHHLMAYFEMFRRDISRFRSCFERSDEMPLGSGALAGTTFPIDRDFVARELGFSSVTANSMDAVSDRDFVIEFVFCCAMVMMHLSRFCEELVIWSSAEFGFVQMDDAFSTGSSMMPQKKNPDVAELVRGKTGRVYGALTALLTLMKSLPLCYNKDMQEDKEQLFDAYDTLAACLGVFTGMFRTLVFDTERMQSRALSGFSNATDCADYLVRRGIPFRDAHEITGQIVRHCIAGGLPLTGLSLEKFRAFSPVFEADVFDALSLRRCVEGRDIFGGTAPSRVMEHIASARAYISSLEKEK